MFLSLLEMKYYFYFLWAKPLLKKAEASSMRLYKNAGQISTETHKLSTSPVKLCGFLEVCNNLCHSAWVPCIRDFELYSLCVRDGRKAKEAASQPGSRPHSAAICLLQAAGECNLSQNPFACFQLFRFVLSLCLIHLRWPAKSTWVALQDIMKKTSKTILVLIFQSCDSLRRMRAAAFVVFLICSSLVGALQSFSVQHEAKQW